MIQEGAAGVRAATQNVQDEQVPVDALAGHGQLRSALVGLGGFLQQPKALEVLKGME